MNCLVVAAPQVHLSGNKYSSVDFDAAYSIDIEIAIVVTDEQVVIFQQKRGGFVVGEKLAFAEELLYFAASRTAVRFGSVVMQQTLGAVEGVDPSLASFRAGHPRHSLSCEPVHLLVLVMAQRQRAETSTLQLFVVYWAELFASHRAPFRKPFSEARP